MSNLEHLTSEDQSEVVKIASRLRDEELERGAQAQENQAFVDAATEMDLKPEYLERAAAELQQTRILAARTRLKRRNTVIATAGCVLVLGAGWAFTHRPPPAPNVYRFSATQWRLNANPESNASVTFENIDGKSNAAVIRVQQFVPRASDGQYFVNLDASPTSSFAGQNATSFFVKGSGLENIRLYLEANQNERWRSPAVQVSSEWQQQTIDISQYDHQIRDAATGQWHMAQGFEHPDRIRTMSFKVGSFMNDLKAHGEVAIDDLEVRQ
jgi:hypothetical protein